MTDITATTKEVLALIHSGAQHTARSPRIGPNGGADAAVPVVIILVAPDEESASPAMTIHGDRVAAAVRQLLAAMNVGTRRRSQSAPPELVVTAAEHSRPVHVPTDVAAAADRSAAVDRLTRREREILDLVAEGYTDAGIAQQLVISRRTVNNHVGSILAKLGVDNRTQAAGYATTGQHVQLRSAV
jgi:DNA-binding NarL/FixJ family response regulator